MNDASFFESREANVPRRRDGSDLENDPDIDTELDDDDLDDDDLADAELIDTGPEAGLDAGLDDGADSDLDDYGDDDGEVDDGDNPMPASESLPDGQFDDQDMSTTDGEPADTDPMAEPIPPDAPPR